MSGNGDLTNQETEPEEEKRKSKRINLEIQGIKAVSGTSLRVGKHDRDEGGGSVDQLSATGSSDDTDEAEYGILVEGLYAILSYCAVGCGS